MFVARRKNPVVVSLKVFLVFYYLLTTGVSDMWVPWAWADLVFLALFYLSWRHVGALLPTGGS